MVILKFSKRKLIYFKKVLKEKLYLLQGYIRISFGFCPYCNSDAPLLYDCPVCCYDIGYPFVGKVKCKVYWDRFKRRLVKDIWGIVRYSVIDEYLLECQSCGWKGLEDELDIDYYDSFNISSPIATNCPECGGEEFEEI